MTLLLLGVSGISALVLGTIIAAMRISPLTLVLLFCAIILPYLGSRLEYQVAAMIGLSVYTSPFVAEALRSGINGVPVGQAEAARSVGLGFGQTVGMIVLPQAFRMTIPPLINVFIALTKNTSVAGGFFVVELFATTRQLANDNGNIVLQILFTAAALYLVITIPLGFLAG